MGFEAEPQAIYQVLAEAAESYANALANARGKLEPGYDTLVSEVLIGMASEEIPTPYRRMRLDFFGRKGDAVGSIISNLDNPRQFRAIRENWQGIEVEARPLVWNGIDFRTDADLSNPTPLIKWYTKWLDPEDARPVDERGLQGVVHSVVMPDKGEDGQWIVPVDFGSAPIEAFSELMEVFRQCGARRIRVESFEMVRRM